MPILRSLLIFSVLLCAPLCADDGTKVVTAEQAAFFEKRVRPVLAEKCFSCHGPEKQELGIRLDSRQAVLQGGDDGKIVTPGNPDQSRLVSAIRYDGDVQMPPEEQLTRQEVAALTRWVKMGLPWPGSDKPTAAPDDAFERHWAYQPVASPDPPEVQDSAWPRTPIDRFILARLESAGLSPSPAADRLTLLRRATFDLTGLPPTAEETAVFLRDQSGHAYEALVDRLLASPHYGERWGRYWLDVARYADNKGYVHFGEKRYPWAYAYRDYVVRALNEDLPYDRFITEQLAADQLEPESNPQALAAMGFLTLGARFSGNVHDIIDDRIDVVTRGLMGLTVTCSRCHDHKFDPIRMSDYYGLYGVFRSSTEPIVHPLFEPPPKTEGYRKFSRELEQRQQKLEKFVTRKHAELVASARERVVEYLMAAHAKRHQPPTENFMLLVEAGDLNPTMIQRWQSYLTRTRKSQDPVWSLWHACAELKPDKFAEGMTRTIEGYEALDSSEQVCHPLVLAAVKESRPTSIEELAGCYGRLLHQISEKWQKMVASAAEQKQPRPSALPDAAEEELRRVFYGAGSPPEVAVLDGWEFLTLLPDRPAQNEFKKLLAELQSHLSSQRHAPPRAMVLYDADERYDPRIFLRGNPHRPGKQVPRRFPQFLSADESGGFGPGSGRLEMARAIVDPANPLTARVLVNRVWLHHFGRGLVRTPSDFGLRSEPPSHPLLLDYLATTFVNDGWSLKRLHRRIMLSSAYRQSSQSRVREAAEDPQNRLLWRMNRRRLDFEALRDSLLAVSGDLDRQIGGPPVDISGSEFSSRRTIYGFVDRMDLPELFRAFDFPDPAATSPGRDTTTIAPQALFLMNHRFVGEVARRVSARHDIATITETTDRVRRVYVILFARDPSIEEAEFAAQFLGRDPEEKNWQQYVQALLMTNEFAFFD